ncbi:chemotaxis protein CheA [Limisalsivibrio acetivorans]|uniref:chemotaxis protein CheA n=1 Tax=Limisalsivibrio acetivorans TaxID=1304888 RepID=UPI0003B4AD38|nr:chemotaxis protein CheA [Limisalsivibrio acetivorans]
MSDDKRQQIIHIFIDEASTIVEEVSLALMELESDPSDKDIINSIFRGIHTLKGSANSFGFTRIGGFVHHFEDLMDIYRSRDEAINEEELELLFSAFDVVKEVLEMEINETEGYPENYDYWMERIKQAVEGGGAAPVEGAPEVVEESQEVLDIVAESKYDTAPLKPLDIAAMPEDARYEAVQRFEEGENVYLIRLILEDDIYFRGYNHTILIKLISETLGVIISVWDMTKVPPIEMYDPEVNYITCVTVLANGPADMEEVDDVFDFTVEETEVQIRQLSNADMDTLRKSSEELLEMEDPEDKGPEIIVPASGEAPDLEIREESAETPESVDEKPPEPAKPAEPPKPVEKKGEPAKDDGGKKPKKKPSSHHSFIRVESDKIDDLFDVVGELVISQSFLYQNQKIRDIGDPEIARNLEALAKSTRMIQNKVMSLRMVPIRDTFNKMRMVARDVSKKTSKDIELSIKGEETEIDKTMVDALSEPLVHMIRNSIDHGVETVQDRIAAGKSPKGHVHLEAYHRGGNIVIEIGDDGKGIDKEVIRQKAIDRGVIKEDDNLTDNEIINLIFDAGFSTAKEISDVSGRGVGLDVVRSSIENLRGKIEVSSEKDEGSVFKLVLPLTLAIIDGLVVQINDETFIIPTLTVIESYRPKKADVNQVKGQGEFVNFRGEMLPILKLKEILHIEGEPKPAYEATLICLEHERGKFLAQVDELVGRQQVVIKNLGSFLESAKNFSGGAILGNGEISLILNVEHMRELLDRDLKIEP